MAIGPIGNVIHVNQQTASVASVANSHNNRVDFQNMVAQAAAQEKDEKVLEVRPAEENHEINPDREHEKNGADQESARNKKREKSDEDEIEESEFPIHKLDIKV
ncbi:MAG: hypothetical protein OQK48_08935 [Sulfurimonas sp.]|uniref:hypothetical protein n=1 Tax=Sulfurimonas sp. TaxID=2022749 RepID=UPI00260243FB|nr:hypothetical protein [Sulfurimonas sp.]MCW8894605.1 hypothetical protein [Sulfurimonas sp.]MCW8955048.1 hypothetical protein [Sulfurimonas sp.]MCW9067445.1 hypothetical protein [Sulfurimonas sp.]